MWKNLTKNLGLKIVSLVAAFILWLVVVNVDDPMISRTYSGIEVEITNADVLTAQGKCYEVLEGSDVINVVVTAKRSVLDEMSKDYIKATADFKSMTLNETVPIEVRSTRYSDRIDSVTSRTDNLKLKLENLVEKSLDLNLTYTGSPEDNYVLSSAESNVSYITISGPESLIERVNSLQTVTNISGINKDVVASQTIEAVDENGVRIVDSRLIIEPASAVVKFVINPTKVLPISSGYSGEPMNGFSVTGVVVTDPSSVRVTGRGENFDDMDVIYIVPDDVSVEGARSDVITEVDISGYLPSGVSFADHDFDPKVQVLVEVEAVGHKVISVPLTNITISNLPEGYTASFADATAAIDVEIQGLGDEFDRYSGDLAIGMIDASTLVPKIPAANPVEGLLQIGENTGTVTFDLPAGIRLVNPVSIGVILDYVGNSVTTEGTEETTQESQANTAEHTDNSETVNNNQENPPAAPENANGMIVGPLVDNNIANQNQ